MAVFSLVASGLSSLLICIIPDHLKTEQVVVILSSVYGGVSIIGWNALDVISTSELFPVQLRSDTTHQHINNMHTHDPYYFLQIHCIRDTGYDRSYRSHHWQHIIWEVVCHWSVSLPPHPHSGSCAHLRWTHHLVPACSAREENCLPLPTNFICVLLSSL